MARKDSLGLDVSSRQWQALPDRAAHLRSQGRKLAVGRHCVGATSKPNERWQGALLVQHLGLGLDLKQGAICI